MKRYLCLLLTAAMLLVSCSNGGKDTDTTKDTGASPADTAENAGEEAAPEEEEESFDPGLPEKNFDDGVFTFLTKSVAAYTDWGETSIWTEATNGEVLNDAVYARNLAIEEKYLITIKEYQSGAPNTDLSNSVLASDGAYDVAMPPLDQIGGLVSNKHLMELHEVPYLNFDQMWWDARSVKDLSIDNKLFMVSGDISTLNNDATWCTMINLTVLENSGIESPYELVKSNQWNMAKYYEICEGVSTDLDGNGIYDNNDLIANLTQNENATAMVIAAGIHLVDKDENDLPVFTLHENQRAVAVFELLNQLMNDEVVSLNYHKYGSAGYHLATTKMFEENRGLFWITNLQMVIRLRDMDTDFGIAPVPKFDEEQENYCNVVWQVGSFLCVPKTTNDLERTGIIIEAMAAESRKILRPAYYEVALSYKYLRDQESIEMLDIIIDNRTYELEKAFGWGVSSAVDSIVLNGMAPASTLKAMSKMLNKTFERVLKVINPETEES